MFWRHNNRAAVDGGAGSNLIHVERTDFVQSVVTEIAPEIYRISTFHPDIDKSCEGHDNRRVLEA
jgi:hypothetical protein